MPISSTGSISMSDIQNEYGGSNPISLSEYYRGGTYVPVHDNTLGIPSSGTISMDDFRGTSATPPIQVVTYTQHTPNYNTSTFGICSTLQTITIYQDSSVFNLSQPIYSNSTGTSSAPVGRRYKYQNGKITSMNDFDIKPTTVKNLIRYYIFIKES